MKNTIRYRVEAADGFSHSYNDQFPNALEYAKDCAKFEKGVVFECELDILDHEISSKQIFDFSKQ